MDPKLQLARIANRRAELVARCAAQRAELSGTCRAWRAPLAIADQGAAAWRFAKKYRALLAGTGVMLAVVRPFHAVKWFKRGWMLWRFYRGATASAGKRR